MIITIKRHLVKSHLKIIPLNLCSCHLQPQPIRVRLRCHMYVWLCAEHPALWVYSGCGALVLQPFLGNFGWVRFGCAMFKARHLISDVTSLKGTVMSYVTSQCHTCVCHMTFYYKRSADALVGVLACCSSVHQVQLYHQRPTCGWCLTRVGCDASSTSLGWSLLPSTVIIVLALVNSAVSPVGTPSISMRPGSCRFTPS